TGRTFTRLDAQGRERFLEAWHGSSITAARHALRALLTGIKAAHVDDPGVFAQVGCRYVTPTVVEESPRWLGQVTDGRGLTEDLELECDVVVVGSGAGGAALAYELAAKGHAVVIMEEGGYFRRGQFNG